MTMTTARFPGSVAISTLNFYNDDISPVEAIAVQEITLCGSEAQYIGKFILLYFL